MNCSAALDTSSNASLAVEREGRFLVQTNLMLHPRTSDAELAPWTVAQVENAGLQLADIRQWTIGVGPGSFSGIRAGIAFLRGVCRGTGADLRGIPGSRALARMAAKDASEGDVLAVLHDGRRGQALLSAYRVVRRRVKPLGPTEAHSFDHLTTLANRWAKAITPHADALSDLLDSLRKKTDIDTTEYVEAGELLNAHLPWPPTEDERESGLTPVYVRPAVFVPPSPVRPSAPPNA